MTPPGDEYDAVLLFDGVCGLCNGVVDFLLRHDRSARIRFAALQSEAGKCLMRACGYREDSLDSVVLVQGTQCYTESAAVLAALGYLGLPWRLTAVFYAVPRSVRDGVYRWVARHRYGWFGRRETCRVPDASERARFLH